jgi:hypothetical protein
MSEDRYEFSYLSKKEKNKILVVRIILLLSIIHSLWSLINTDYYATGAAYYDAAWETVIKSV